jgi:hypothetical protein
VGARYFTGMNLISLCNDPNLENITLPTMKGQTLTGLKGYMIAAVITISA